MERGRSKPLVTVTQHLLAAISAAPEGVWDLPRARQVAGAGVSADTCRLAMRHLEELGAIVQTEPGRWQRSEAWPGTQADYYT